MQTAPHPRSHRFVVVWRAETREIAGAAPVERGWVERIPDPRAAETDGDARDRQGLVRLADLPGVIEAMMARAARPGGKEGSA
ncbi:MAG: hypothetical protein ACT4OK_04730 [Gemmobacter sp.]